VVISFNSLCNHATPAGSLSRRPTTIVVVKSSKLSGFFTAKSESSRSSTISNSSLELSHVGSAEPDDAVSSIGDPVAVVVWLGIVVSADDDVDFVEAGGGYETGESVAAFVDVDVEDLELVDDFEEEDEDEDEEDDDDDVDVLFDDVLDFLIDILFAFSFSSSSGVKPYVNPSPCFSGL